MFNIFKAVVGCSLLCVGIIFLMVIVTELIAGRIADLDRLGFIMTQNTLIITGIGVVLVDRIKS